MHQLVKTLRVFQPVNALELTYGCNQLASSLLVTRQFANIVNKVTPTMNATHDYDIKLELKLAGHKIDVNPKVLSNSSPNVQAV